MRPIDTSDTPGRQVRALWLAAGLATLLAAAMPAAADVYKWLDPQGHTHYSDRPPPADAKLLSVEPGAGTHHAERAPPPAAPTAAAPAPASAADAARLKQQVDADVASTRAAQCKAAQERYQNYVGSRRIFKEGANQERIYLSDAEAETERLNARRAVAELCGDAER